MMRPPAPAWLYLGMKHSLALLAALLVACTDQTVDRPLRAPAEAEATEEASGDEESPADAGRAVDAGASTDADAGPEAPRCTTRFGKAITEEFGRLDGTVRAVVAPGDFTCPGDDDHVIVQVDAAGATYAIWINVQSNLASDPDVRFRQQTADDLPGPSWSPGWHPSPGGLDYALDLGAHAASLSPMTKAQLSAAIVQRVRPGARVSVFADGFATADGAHKVHRNGGGEDGALVVDPTGARTFLLFAFAGQSF